MEKPPKWAIERARELAAAEPNGTNFLNAHARYIAQHEEKPVDPNLLAAREICAAVAEDLNAKNTAVCYREGYSDKTDRIQLALAELRKAEARGRGEA